MMVSLARDRSSSRSMKRDLPEADAAGEAGELIMELPDLWAKANLEERRKLLLTMLDAVYVDIKESKSIVAIQPKAPFRPVFEVATTREGSGVLLIKEPPEVAPEDTLCLLVETGESRTPRPEEAPVEYATGLVGSLFLVPRGLCRPSPRRTS